MMPHLTSTVNTCPRIRSVSPRIVKESISRLARFLKKKQLSKVQSHSSRMSSSVIPYQSGNMPDTSFRTRRLVHCENQQKKREITHRGVKGARKKHHQPRLKERRRRTPHPVFHSTSSTSTSSTSTSIIVVTPKIRKLKRNASNDAATFVGAPPRMVLYIGTLCERYRAAAVSRGSRETQRTPQAMNTVYVLQRLHQSSSGNSGSRCIVSPPFMATLLLHWSWI